MKWTNIGQESTVVWDRGVSKTKSGTQYTDATPETSYLVVAVVEGVKHRATCELQGGTGTTTTTAPGGNGGGAAALKCWAWKQKDGKVAVGWNKDISGEGYVWDHGHKIPVKGRKHISQYGPGKVYVVIVIIAGVKQRCECPINGGGGSTTTQPPATTTRPTTTPGGGGTLQCTATMKDGKAVIRWNNIGQSENYIWDRGVKAPVSGRTYTDSTPEGSYVVIVMVNGVKHRAECSLNGGGTTTTRPSSTTTRPTSTTTRPTSTTTRPTSTTTRPTSTTTRPTSTTTRPTSTTARPTTTVPGTPPVCQRIEGPTVIAEGSEGQYRIVLTKAARTTMTFQVVVNDGSAHRVGDVAGKENQDIMWNGYYTKRTTTYFLGVPISTSSTKVYDRVGNGTGAGDRAMVGPKEVNWDFTIYQNGMALNGNVVMVTVNAGDTTSNYFTIKAWREKVTISLIDPTDGHVEGNESFSISAGGTCQMNGTITDTSEYPQISPITLDLDGDGIETTAVTATSPKFDLLGGGRAVRSGWTSDALLAHDDNANGKIDDGSELFGGYVGDGYRELARFDSNRDGVVNRLDRGYPKLSVWVDADQDRVTDAGELRSLAQAGVASVGLRNRWAGVRSNGNTIGEVGVARGADGRVIRAADVYFRIGG